MSDGCTFVDVLARRLHVEDGRTFVCDRGLLFATGGSVDWPDG